MSAAHDVEALLANLARLSSAKGGGCAASGLRLATHRKNPALELSRSELASGLADLLPDGGLPRGVVELAAIGGLGGSTSVALEAVRAGQARSRESWCAWIDPEGTLHAPGVVARGVDLGRLLVVRPPRSQIGRVAVKLMGAGAFEVVVVDIDTVPGASRRAERVDSSCASGARKLPKRRAWAPEVLVRKLALAAESSGATVLLLTDATCPRAQPWPVSLRLELSRPSLHAMAVRIAKDRRGRIGMAKTIPFSPLELPGIPRKAAG
jgi:hypothetical protein